MENTHGGTKAPGDALRLLEKLLSGASKAIREVRSLVMKYAPLGDPVLILGENGVGKSHAAGLLHRLSGRPGKFVLVDTPNIQDNLLESKLFGHKKGAFTGAHGDTPGFVDEARGGTLFFDEIMEVPCDVQVKLLRFIETKSYHMLGDPRERKADVRIVTATNRPLETAMKAGKVRQDLYFRLSVFQIRIPPLRERKEDIEAFIAENKPLLDGKKPGSGFWETLRGHSWPGNVRELQSVLKRLALLDGERVSGADLAKCLDRVAVHPEDDGAAARDAADVIWDDLMAGKNFWDAVKRPFLDREIKRAEVRKILEKGLAKSGGRYVGVIGLFNLPRSEYKNFMRFLYENKLR